MKSLLFSTLSLLFLSCEVRNVDDKKTPPPAETPEKPAPLPLLVDTPPVEPAKPKTLLKDQALDKALAYSLPNATGLFVIDVRRLVASPMLSTAITELNSLFVSNPSWLEVSKAGLNPLLNLQGAVISFRQPSGGSDELVLTLVGSFDEKAFAKSFHDSPTRGDSDAEPADAGIVLIGKAAHLTEAKLAAARGALVDSPAVLAALSSMDTSRPLLGVFFPRSTTRASAHGSERANKVTIEFDATKDLSLQVAFQFDTPKEAEDARVELDDGLKQMVPMFSIFGIPDTSLLLKSVIIKADGSLLSLLLNLDGATATTIFEGIARFAKGTKPTPPVPPPALE